jgi:hypothetical protein
MNKISEQQIQLLLLKKVTVTQSERGADPVLNQQNSRAATKPDTLP